MRQLDRGQPIYPIWSRRQYVLAQYRYQVLLILLPVLLSLPSAATAEDLKERPEVVRVREFVTSAVAGLDNWRAVNVDKNMDIAAGPEYAKVFEAAANARKLVLIGDPGAGKSTLSRYLLLCILALLTGERTALNFIQSLSGTATLASRYAEAVAGTGAVV